MDKFAKDYWNSRYQSGGNSGYGSYDDQLSFKIMWLSELKGIDSISEIGCGDFNFGKTLLESFTHAKYVGYDISDNIVEKNKKDFPSHTFTNELSEVPPADLVLCIDVLFHIINDQEYERVLNALEKKFTKYLAITAYEYDQQDGLGRHLKIRKFDYSRFGEPILRKVVEEDGQMYFYIFRK